MYSLLAFGGAVPPSSPTPPPDDDDDRASSRRAPLGSDCGFDDVQAAIGNASVMTLATNTRRLRIMCFPFV